MGVCGNGQLYCEGADYLHGPMAVIVSQVVEGRHDYSVIDAGNYRFASEAAITMRASEVKPPKRSPELVGKKRKKETGYFHRNARVLARIAKDIKATRNDEVVAVLFRDSDGTASAGRGLWANKVQSMLDGFAEEGFERGVPMVPKPKSEAWVFCALKQNHNACDALEDRSGNDNSPNSLKGELESHLGYLPDRKALCDMVEKRAIDIDQLQMPSFLAFRVRLEQVI